MVNIFKDNSEIRVNIATRKELYGQIERQFILSRGFTLATINVDHIVKLNQNDTFRRSYALHDYVVADGNPIVWMSKISGRSINLIPGSELILPICELAEIHGKSVAIFGSSQNSLELASKNIRDKCRNLNICCLISPPMSFDPNGDDANEYFDIINESGADICFIALGAPKQEIFAAKGKDFSPSVGFISIGAGIDFIAGSQKRAPKWVRSIAMEWFWRMAISPKRLTARYFKCMTAMPKLIAYALAQRLAK